MRKSQSALEYLMSYGWVIIILVIIGGVLYLLGVFNPNQDTSTVVYELSNFHVDDALLSSNGDVNLELGVRTGQTTQVSNIDYSIEGYNCSNLVDESDFNISPDGTLLVSLSSDSSCDLEERTMVYMNVTITYTKRSGLEHTDRGRIRILVQPISTASGNFTWFTGTESSFNEGTYINTTYGSVMLDTNYLTGTYTSKVFDVGTNASWNNISWGESMNYSEEFSSLSNVVGWWHFNEPKWTGSSGEVIDSSGNNFHATAYGEATTTSNSRFFMAGLFDGRDDYVSKRYERELHPRSWSLEAWINPANLDNPMTIISYDIYYLLDINHAKVRVGRDCGGLSGWQFATGSTEIPKNEWSHIVGTWDGTVLKIYYNGELEDENKPIQGMIMLPRDPPLLIGEKRRTYFNGIIDEVIIYNAVLEQSEIQEHYKQGIMNLTLQTRSCDNSNCDGEDWQEFFTLPLNDLNINDNQYFQYKFNFYTENSSYSPILYNVTVNYEIS